MIPHVTLNVDAPPGLVVLVALTIVVTCLAAFGLEIYKAQALLEEWDRTRDDADLGARGVERHDAELAELREEVTAAMLSHAEQIDALHDALLTDTEPVTLPTIEAAAAIDEWHRLVTRRPVPHRRESPAS